MVEPVSEGCGPRALAWLRGDPQKEVEGAGATFSEEASHPGRQLPLPPPAPQPFLPLTFSLRGEEAEGQQTRFRGWVRASLFWGLALLFGKGS